MTDKKISELTAVTTPLAGTEVLPIVQSSSTKKVTVANLTAGRSISTAGASLDGAVTINDTGAAVDFRVEGDTDANLIRTWASVDRASVGWNPAFGTPTGKLTIGGPYDSNAPSTSTTPALKINEGGAVSLWLGGYAYQYNYIQSIQDDGSNAVKWLVLQPLGGNVVIANSNLAMGTAGTGIDFSANANAAGMTSELLADYEEGTWTPTLLGTTTNPTQSYFIQQGRYTKIGNRVYFNAYIYLQGSGITPGSGDAYIGGLPFSAASGDGGASSVSVSGLYWLTTNMGAPSHAYIKGGASTIDLYVYENSGGKTGTISTASAGDCDDHASLIISGHYLV